MVKTLNNLGGHVNWVAYGREALLTTRGIEFHALLGKTEVGDFDIPLRVKKDIFELEVSFDYVLVVQTPDGLD